MKSKYPLIQEQFEDIKFLIKVKGYSEKDLIEVLPISKDTFYKYKNDYPDFSDLLKDTQTSLLGKIEEGYFKAATGYEYVETSTEIILDANDNVVGKKIKKVKKYKHPNTGAARRILTKLSPFWANVEKKEVLDIDQIIDDQTLQDLLDEEIEDPI